MHALLIHSLRCLCFQVKLYPIKKWQDLFNSVECYLLRYCEEFELDECPLVLSDFVLRQLMRLHRAVNFARYKICKYVYERNRRCSF